MEVKINLANRSKKIKKEVKTVSKKDVRKCNPTLREMFELVRTKRDLIVPHSESRL